MASTVNEVFDAIDQYMQNKGKGNQYLFKKFEELFEGNDSVFNPNNSVLKKVLSNFVSIDKPIKDFNQTVNSLNIKVRILMASLKPKTFNDLNNIADKLRKKIEKYEKSFTIPQLSTTQRLQNLVFPKKAYDVFDKIRTDIGAIRMISTRMEKILVTKSKESVLRGPQQYPQTSNTNYSRRTINILSNNSLNGEGGSSGGLLSRFFGMVLSGGAAFLGIGFVRNFLKDSPLGQVMLNNVTAFFSSIGDAITQFIKSGALTETVESSVVAIKDMFNYIVNGVETLWEENKPEIKKLGTDTIDILNKHVLTPYLDGAKEAWEKNDWSTLIIGGLGTLAFYTILSRLPVLKQLDSYIIRPLLNAAIKTPALNILKSISARLLPLITNLATKLGIAGIIAAELVWTADSLKKVSKTVGEIHDTLNESKEIMTKTNNSMMNKLDKQFNNRQERLDELNNIKKTRELSFQEKKEEQVLQLEIQRTRQEQERLKLNEKYQGGIKGILFNSLKALEDFGVGDSYLLKKQREEYSTLDKSIKELNDKISLLKTPVRRVEDAEIVIPDKKDTHLFAKGGGPFDKALKEVNKKVDTIIDVLNGGFVALAQVTAQSSGTVAQAVLASSGSKESVSPTIIGGSNPIYRHRLNTGRHIEFSE